MPKVPSLAYPLLVPVSDGGDSRQFPAELEAVSRLSMLSLALAPLTKVDECDDGSWLLKGWTGLRLRHAIHPPHPFQCACQTVPANTFCANAQLISFIAVIRITHFHPGVQAPACLYITHNLTRTLPLVFPSPAWSVSPGNIAPLAFLASPLPCRLAPFVA